MGKVTTNKKISRNIIVFTGFYLTFLMAVVPVLILIRIGVVIIDIAVRIIIVALQVAIRISGCDSTRVRISVTGIAIIVVRITVGTGPIMGRNICAILPGGSPNKFVSQR
jgi:hypothetical protein